MAPKTRHAVASLCPLSRRVTAVYYDKENLNVYRCEVDALAILDEVQADEKGVRRRHGVAVVYVELDRYGIARWGSDSQLGYEFNGVIDDWTDEVKKRIEQNWGDQAQVKEGSR